MYKGTKRSRGGPHLIAAHAYYIVYGCTHLYGLFYWGHIALMPSATSVALLSIAEAEDLWEQLLAFFDIIWHFFIFLIFLLFLDRLFYWLNGLVGLAGLDDWPDDACLLLFFMWVVVLLVFWEDHIEKHELGCFRFKYSQLCPRLIVDILVWAR